MPWSPFGRSLGAAAQQVERFHHRWLLLKARRGPSTTSTDWEPAETRFARTVALRWDQSYGES